MIARNGALLFSVNQPQLIRELLPTAKQISYKGKEIFAVRHTLDAATVLRNIGLDAPSPILYDGYRFSGRFMPMEHQITGVEFLTLNRRAYNLSTMGTGKTASALWALDYLMQRGQVKKTLVICPLSVIGVWANEAFSVTPHRHCIQLVGKREKRLDLLEEKADIYAINFDGVVSIQEAIEKAHFDLIIIDEASAYCNPQNKRYKAVKKLIKPTTRVWLLTGTPTPNAPTDAYGLVKLINPEAIKCSFKMFRERLMRQYGPYKWVPKPDAVNVVNQLMQPAIRFTKEECLDLPPLTYNDRVCDLSKKQQRVFEDMKSKMRHEEEQSEITAVNAAVKLLKLQQIACGVVKDVEGEPMYLDPTPRLKLLNEIIEEADSKVIVFVPFIYAMHMIQNELQKKWTTELVNGKVGRDQRNDIFHRFQHEDNPKVLVAHPKVAAHGLTLTAASTIVWYAPIFSTEQYEQANARIERKGQKNAMSIYHLVAHPFEKGIYDVLQSKASLQSQLLGLYSQAME